MSTPKSIISLPEGFRFGAVNPIDHVARPEEISLATALVGAEPPPPPLGALAHFAGTWVGTGFNTIFRPDNPVTPTNFPNPIPPGPPRDNVLELNITKESLTFSPPLGQVPNRGSGNQGDINLNGVPYLQAITDVSTGKGIHVEPGLWMAIPGTTATPVEGATVTRMASIPHGTTINAQGTVSVAIPGKPTIPAVNITPIVIATGAPATFPSQTANLTNTARIPQDLSSFMQQGMITQAMLANPNSVLDLHTSKQTVLSTIAIQIATTPPAPLFGGGTDNIAFLLGDIEKPPVKPNANATQMTATFYIETVQHTLLLPVYSFGDPPLLIPGQGSVPGQAVPMFRVQPLVNITSPTSITVTSTQIQYTQTVILVFAGLTWPHVSVATLVPADPICITPNLL